MTQYLNKRFSVPASGKRQSKEPCRHDWVDSRGACVLCGERVQERERPACLVTYHKDFGVLTIGATRLHTNYIGSSPEENIGEQSKSD